MENINDKIPIELRQEWEMMPNEIRAKAIGKDKCFGDLEAINGASAACRSCPLWNECLRTSLRMVLKVHDTLYAAATQ